MIFVVLGTHHQPFVRLTDAIEGLEREDVVVQHGHSPAPRGVREARQFLTIPDFEEHMRFAEVVVTHAGVGSILLARRLGHTPVVVPRRQVHGEHVDDHQVELTVKLAETRKVVPLWDVDNLVATVAAAPRPGPSRQPAEGPLHRAVRAALVGGGVQ